MQLKLCSLILIVIIFCGCSSSIEKSKHTHVKIPYNPAPDILFVFYGDEYIEKFYVEIPDYKKTDSIFIYKKIKNKLLEECIYNISAIDQVIFSNYAINFTSIDFEKYQSLKHSVPYKAYEISFSRGFNSLSVKFILKDGDVKTNILKEFESYSLELKNRAEKEGFCKIIK